MNWQSVLRSGADFGPRFSLVGILPTTFLVVFVVALSWSGAPSKPLSSDRLLSTARELTAGEAVLLVVVVLFTALLLQPLQRPLVRLLEGYWAEDPRVPAWLAIAACRGQRRRFGKLSDMAYSTPRNTSSTDPTGISGAYYALLRWVCSRRDSSGDEGGRMRWTRPDEFKQQWQAFGRRRRRAASARQRSLFPPKQRILPTALGNALRAAEDAVRRRYGLDGVTLWPALYSVLSPPVREVVDDARNQLDIAVRLCAVLLGCALASVALLWRYPLWMLGFVVAACLGSRLAYRAAVSAATQYGVMIHLAFDRHRFDLLAGLHLPQPPDSETEREANKRLTEHLVLNTPLLLRYQHPDPNSREGRLSSSTADRRSGGQVQDS